MRPDEITTGARVDAARPLQRAVPGARSNPSELRAVRLFRSCKLWRRNDGCPLVKEHSPHIPLASPHGTAQRCTRSIGCKRDPFSDGQDLQVAEAALEVRRGQQLSDHVLLGVRLAGAAKFDELIRD